MFQAKKEAVMIATTRPEMSVSEPTLYVAFELGQKEWKLAMTSRFCVAARLLGGAAGVERSARDERGGGGRAPGQSRADGADARADASDQSTEGLAGDVGRHAAATSPERLVDHSERLGGGTPARRSASARRPG